MRKLKKELWPNSVEIHLDQYHARHAVIEEWLGDNMGAFKGRWNFVPHHSGVCYYFRNGKDSTMFSLRWS